MNAQFRVGRDVVVVVEGNDATDDAKRRRTRGFFLKQQTPERVIDAPRARTTRETETSVVANMRRITRCRRRDESVFFSRIVLPRPNTRSTTRASTTLSRVRCLFRRHRRLFGVVLVAADVEGSVVLDLKLALLVFRVRLDGLALHRPAGLLAAVHFHAVLVHV